MIDPSARIAAGAKVGRDVSIGPYCIIGPDVTLGDGCRLISHVSITGHTSIGPRTTIYPFVSLGTPPQSVKYRGGPTRLVIGADCDIREGFTANIGTEDDGGITEIGDRCFFMVSTHVGHDCKVGNNVILANNTILGGHVSVGDNVVFGGGVAVRQFVRIGEGAMIVGLSGVRADVIPWGMAHGPLAHLIGLNVIGMRRNGAAKSDILNIRRAYQALFFGEGEFRTRLDATGARIRRRSARAQDHRLHPRRQTSVHHGDQTQRGRRGAMTPGAVTRQDGPLALICGGGSLPLTVAEAAAGQGRQVMLFLLRGIADPALAARYPHHWLYSVRPAGSGGWRAPKAAARWCSSARWCGRRSGRCVSTCGRCAGPALRRGFSRRRRSSVVRGRPHVRAARLSAHRRPCGGAGNPDAGRRARERPAVRERPQRHRARFRLSPRHRAVRCRAGGGGRRPPCAGGGGGGRHRLDAPARCRDAQERPRARAGRHRRAGEGAQARPGQRFDLPAIGPRTVEGVARAGLAGMAVAAGSSIIAEPEKLVAAADRAKVFVFGAPAAAQG